MFDVSVVARLVKFRLLITWGKVGEGVAEIKNSFRQREEAYANIGGTVRAALRQLLRGSRVDGG
jgi:hypothetical protein